MERRVFLAISLSILVIYGYQLYFAPRPDPATTSAPTQAAQATPSTAAPAGTAPAPEPDAPRADTPAAITSDSTEQQIVIDTGKVEAVVTNRGGRILNWRLKDFVDEQGRPVDLIPSDLPATEPRPLSLAVEDAQLTRRLNEALYRVSSSGTGRIDATK